MSNTTLVIISKYFSKKEEIRSELTQLLSEKKVDEKPSDDVENCEGFIIVDQDNIDESEESVMKRRSSQSVTSQHNVKKQCSKNISVETHNNSAETSATTEHKHIVNETPAADDVQSTNNILTDNSNAAVTRDKKKKKSVKTLLEKSKWRVRELEGHEDLVLDCVLSSDGSLLASASRDTTVKVWSTDTGDLVLSCRGHTAPVTGVRFLETSVDMGQTSGHRSWVHISPND